MALDVSLVKLWMDKLINISPIINSDEEDFYFQQHLLSLERQNDNSDSDSYIRVKEYSYDDHDRCLACGYFDYNYDSSSGMGYCTKLGEDTSPESRSCHFNIIL